MTILKQTTRFWGQKSKPSTVLPGETVLLDGFKNPWLPVVSTKEMIVQSPDQVVVIEKCDDFTEGQSESREISRVVLTESEIKVTGNGILPGTKDEYSWVKGTEKE